MVAQLLISTVGMLLVIGAALFAIAGTLAWPGPGLFSSKWA